MKERYLPIGIQDFEKLRNDNYIYVDKTKFVYELGRKDLVMNMISLFLMLFTQNMKSRTVRSFVVFTAL